jgi:2-methylisocitrate lyase-like PEP mutase family enzyme
VHIVTSSEHTSVESKAVELLRLHTDPELLVVVNVWDVATATVVAAQPRCRAIATASHSIAAAMGYPDGEQIPVDLMIDIAGRIAAAVDLPVTADLEAGYGNPGETIRKAIGVGVVGANLEDQMRSLADSGAAVRAAVRAGEAEGVPFVLNARTDAFLMAGERDRGEVLADAIERGRAFLDEGASCVFVPGRFDEATVAALVEGIGERKVSLIVVPGSLPLARLAELGVARVSFGPWIQRATLTYLAGVAHELLAGGVLPEGVEALI